MTKDTDNHDWKAIATELAKGIRFAIAYMKPSSPGGAMLNTKTGEMSSVWEHLGKCLEHYPGVTIDYEMLELNSLPRTKRIKAVKELQEKRRLQKQGEN